MGENLRLRVRPLGRVDAIARLRRALRGRMPVFLHSSLRDPDLGRYSFLATDPAGWFRSRDGVTAYATPWGEGRETGDPFAALGRFLDGLPKQAQARMAFPFSARLAGYFSYDLGRFIERVDDRKGADLGTPDIHLGLYLHQVVLDHVWGEAFDVAPRDLPAYEPPPIPDGLAVAEDPKAIRPLDRDAYVANVARVKDAIAEGEIFQANLSQRFSFPVPGTPADGYVRLQERTPALFGGYLDAGDHQVLSASPERFLKVRGRDAETRPIKGTRPRGATPEEDRRLAAELLASEKDAAENVMIVDLERNDLGKVCEFGSVRVPLLRVLRSFPTVHHLESVVTGRLRDDVPFPGVLRAMFPGGSITGAPKPRAMEIIEALEPHRRGVYTGALGYVALDGSVDLNIAIRTATVIHGTAHFAVGGGIVADSDPEAEYRETLDKLRGHAEALTGETVQVEADHVRVAGR